MNKEFRHYASLLEEIKDRIRQSQTRAAFSANAEMIAMYWDIGRMIQQRQREKGWGAGVIPRLAADLKNELPEVKGFSERNIGYMIRFAREYGIRPILQQPVSKLLPPGTSTEKVPQPEAQLPEKNDFQNLQRLVAKIPWGHNILLAEYALRGMNKPIGVSEYELTRTLPDELKSSLPSIDELEKELEQETEGEGS